MRQQRQTARPKQIVDVISDHDSTQWIMLLNHQEGLAELLPVIHVSGADKKLVLWNERKVLRLDYRHDTSLQFAPHGQVLTMPA